MAKIICSSCGKEIKSLNELVTCSSGLFKVEAYHSSCYQNKDKKKAMVIFKPNNSRLLHKASAAFTVLALSVMIFLKNFSLPTVFSVAAILVLDVYIFMSWSKIERYVK